jgi:predicted cupin superfamily sugar epimerase
MPTMTADQIIEHLAMQPHPEGGFYCETFRDTQRVDENGRAASTAIYFLLKAGQSSHWHTVDAAEIWHWYAGAPLELGIAPPQGPAERITLGNDLTGGHRPQAVVPPGYWQKAASLGDYTLVGCTVAPGFIFDAFVLAPPGFEPGAA